MTIQSILDKLAGTTPNYVPVAYTAPERKSAKNVLDRLLAGRQASKQKLACE